MQTNTFTGQVAQEGLLRGVQLATDVVKRMYGPRGANAIIEDTRFPGRIITNDAQSVIQAMECTDPLEKQGLGLIKELSDKAEKDSADGRKTTILIGSSIFEQGMEVEDPLQLKRELDALLPLIEQKIDEQKQDISVEEVHKVASIAGESEEIGQVIGKIYKEIGKEGIIHLEGSGTYHTSVEYINGVRFNGTGYLSPSMVHDEEATKEGKRETKAVYENPTILVTKRKIQSVNDIDPLLRTLQAQDKKDLVIFTDDMDASVASMLIALHQSKVMNILIIKAPVLWKQYVFEDFAKITGSTIVEDATGLTFKNLPLTALGTCGKIIVDKEECVVMGIKDITDHLQDLKDENTDDAKLRLAWLTTKTAILKLGANSESELSYKRLKCADAINSSRLALIDGVVVGGGYCLFGIGSSLRDTDSEKILGNALQAPLLQLVVNANEKDWSTYTMHCLPEQVVDAAVVVKNAVRNAISLAGTALTAQVVITLPKKTKEEMELELLSARRPY